jgi:hypothetical protein
MKVTCIADLANAPRTDGGDISLRYADCREANLKGVNLRFADLTGANFASADLRGADLTDANLESVVFGGAKLAGADLRCARVVYTSFAGADLSGAILCGLRFVMTRFDSACLSGADLTDATLESVSLEDADLVDANLDGIRQGWAYSDVVGELLRREAGEDPIKKAIAVGIRSDKRVFWRDALRGRFPGKRWAFRTLRALGAPEKLLQERKKRYY